MRCRSTGNSNLPSTIHHNQTSITNWQMSYPTTLSMLLLTVCWLIPLLTLVPTLYGRNGCMGFVTYFIIIVTFNLCTLVTNLWSQTIPGFTNEPWVAPSLPIVRSIIIHPKISNSRDGKIHKLCKWNGAIFEWLLLIFGVCALILVDVLFSGANFSAAKSC